MIAVAAVLPETAGVLRVLETYSRAAVRRAKRALAVVFEHLGTEGQDQRSRLTGDGYPLEFVFSTLDPALRYTCEGAGPALSPELRLAAAEQLLVELGGPGRFPVRCLQEGGPLEYGAWLGGRHSETADSYKLYVEVPATLSPDARKALERVLGNRKTLLESQVFTLRMVGWDIVSGRFELYFGALDLEPRDLAGLVGFCGLAGLEEPLLDLIGQAGGRPARLRLPGSQHGFSVALMPEEKISHFSFFLFARSCFGNDATTRARLLALAEQNRWDVRGYRAVSKTLAKRADPRCWHGIVSFVIAREQPPGLQIGLRPPPVAL